MPTPKITLLMITAREDKPFMGRKDLHVFEPTLEALKNQTFQDFEWLIMDVLYETRKDYFKNMDLPFKVKHIPAQPNQWLQKGLPGICTQYNKGIIHADGELLFFFGDSHIVRSDFTKSLWDRYRQGFFPLAWYLYDNTFGNATRYPAGTPKRTAPVPYDILGYKGQDVFIEHRYDIAFKAYREIYPAPWEWYFGCSSASLEAMLEINGFNSAFDGDRMLLDCDVGSRLELAGYGRYFAMFKDIFLIRIPTDANVWSSAVPKDVASIKCQYPLIHYARYFNRPKANTYIIGDEEIKWIKEEFCANLCRIRQQCKTEHPWQFPFEHKEGYGHKCKKELFEYWKTHQTLIDLREEREKRINGDEKYLEGTFT